MNTKPSKDGPQERLERAVNERQRQKYILRLYVTGMTARSTLAIENIRRLCEEHLKGRYELEVIDIYKHPEQARAGQIIAAPTLIRELPLPLRRYIGDLTNSEKILVSLDAK